MKQRLIRMFKKFHYMEVNIFNLIIMSCLEGWGNNIPRDKIEQEFRECLDGNDEFVKTETTKGGSYALAGHPIKDWDRKFAKDVFKESAVSHEFISISGEEFYRFLSSITESESFGFVESLFRTVDAGRYCVEKYPSNAFVRELRVENDYFEYAEKGKGSFRKKNSAPAPVNRKKKKLSRKTKKGKVYVLSNPSMPGILKIGETGDPVKRVKDLSSKTAVPEDFELEYAVLVEDCVGFENKLHKEFDYCRISKDREFFRIDAETVIKKASELYLEEQNSS